MNPELDQKTERLVEMLRRENLDESVAEQIHPVGLCNVPVQGRRVELRQDEDPAEVGVQAVADWNVDQPVLPTDWHGRFRSLSGERKQSRSLPATENERKNLVVHGRPGKQTVHLILLQSCDLPGGMIGV